MLISRTNTLLNSIIVATTIFLHGTIKVYSKYMDYKYQYLNLQNSNSSAPMNKTININSKHTVTLGSAIFFSVVLLGGFIEIYGTRNTRLFVYLPLQLTTMTVFFPLFTIFYNPKLKKHFLQLFLSISKLILCFYPHTKISPIV